MNYERLLMSSKLTKEEEEASNSRCNPSVQQSSVAEVIVKHKKASLSKSTSSKTR